MFIKKHYIGMFMVDEHISAQRFVLTKFLQS